MIQKILSRGIVLRCTHAFQLLLLTRTASSFSSTMTYPRRFVQQQQQQQKQQRYYSLQSTELSPPSTTCLFGSPLTFASTFESIEDYNSTLIIGKKASLEALMPDLLEPLGLSNLETPIMDEMIKSINEKKGGSSSTLLVTNNGDDSSVHKVALGGLPSKLSRNNHPMAVHSLTKLASAAKGNTRIVVLTDDFSIGPLASAIAKAFPVFSLKSKPPKERTVSVVFCTSEGKVVSENLESASAAAEGVQLAARLVDSHPELLTTTQFAKEVADMIKDFPNVRMKQLIGEQLLDYGGLYAVGKAATCPPRMIILEYDGDEGSNDETVALVGKVRDEKWWLKFLFRLPPSPAKYTNNVSHPFLLTVIGNCL